MVEAGVFTNAGVGWEACIALVNTLTDAGVGWEACMVGADTFTDAGVGWEACMVGADTFTDAGVGWEAGMAGVDTFTDVGVGWETCMVGVDTFTDAGVGWETGMAGANGMFVEAGAGWEAGVVGTGMFAGTWHHYGSTLSVLNHILCLQGKNISCVKIEPHPVYRKETLLVAAKKEMKPLTCLLISLPVFVYSSGLVFLLWCHSSPCCSLSSLSLFAAQFWWCY